LYDFFWHLHKLLKYFSKAHFGISVIKAYVRFQDKIEVSKNDMFNFNMIKFFGINTRSGKVFRLLLIRWEFPSLGWVKINTDGATRGYPNLATCGCIFRGSMGEFIGAFSVFLEIQTTMVVEFYGVIHAMEEAQKMGLTNVWLECDSGLVCVAFTAWTNVSLMLRNRLNICLN